MVDKALFAMIEYFGTNHKWIEHTLKVFGYARLIGMQEQLDRDRMEIVECAAALHDIGVWESERIYGSVQGDFRERMSAEVAGELLQSLQFPEERIQQIVLLIRYHRSFDMDIGKAHGVLVDAVLLAGIGGMATIAPEQLRERLHTKCAAQLLHTLCGIQPKLPVRTM